MMRRSFMWLMIFGIGLLAFAPVATSAETAWIDELSNSVSFYKATYPNSDWKPYQDKLTLVRQAVDRGDQRTVRMEMGKWFKMLRNRDYGIHDVAADELFNFAVMVTPVQEYGIMVPTQMPAIP
ncbi:MAG TPA: hypothetical protein VN666_13185 [Nitrospira sp.]|nr:hypothetical protein [Nitrospira sp.]